MKLVILVLIIFFGFWGVMINIIKKWVMNHFSTIFGEINMQNVLQIGTWIALLSNWGAWLVLGMGFASWFLGMWIMQLEDMSKIVMLMYGIGIPFIILNVFAGMLVFGDKLTPSQWWGIGLVVVASAISIPGVHLIGGGKLW